VEGEGAARGAAGVSTCGGEDLRVPAIPVLTLRLCESLASLRENRSRVYFLAKTPGTRKDAKIRMTRFVSRARRRMIAS